MKVGRCFSGTIKLDQDTFVLAALITGNTKLAGAVALAEILTKTALYSVYERAWALVPWGRR